MTSSSEATPPSRPASPSRPVEAQAPVLQVNLNSPVPPYEQLREQIAGLIATSELKPGNRLPPVRQLAADLGLAGGTVARAYRELEQAGLIEGRGRHGTVVRDAAAESGQDESRRQQLTAAAAHLAKTARELGFSDEAALAAARGALSRAATGSAG
jgi:GntR family transcriptional regulator